MVPALVKLISSQKRVDYTNCEKCYGEKLLVALNVEPRERMALGSRDGLTEETFKEGLKIGKA